MSVNPSAARDLDRGEIGVRRRSECSAPEAALLRLGLDPSLRSG